MAEIGLFDAIHSARSLRRFKPDPVPDDVITKVLDAAIRAPSGSNQQSWEFVVVKDAAQRKKIGAVYQKGGAILKALYADRVKPEHMTEDTYNKLTASAYYLIDHMADAPVLLIVCLKQVPMTGAPPKLPPEVAAAMKSVRAALFTPPRTATTAPVARGTSSMPHAPCSRGTTMVLSREFCTVLMCAAILRS